MPIHFNFNTKIYQSPYATQFDKKRVGKKITNNLVREKSNLNKATNDITAY